MKFIYFTDLHIKGVNPGKRKDVFYVAILKKLMEIGHIITNEQINFVVIGGDLFDLPKISNQLLGEVAKIIKSWKVRVFVVPGNHDLYGQNIATLPHTSLGILANAGVVTILSRENSPIYVGKKNDQNYPLIAFTGQEYYPEIDTGVSDDYEIERSIADYNILVAHGMLLEKPFHPDVPFTLIKDVTTSANMVLSGHYHPDEVDIVQNNTHFIKPRSAGRLEATKHNIDHMPQYVIVDIQKTNGVINTSHSICDFTWAAKGSDIFDYEGQVEEKIYKNTLKQFKEQIGSIDLTKTIDLPQMIKTIAKSDSGVEYHHIESALEYLIDSEKTTIDKSLNGFVSNSANSYIEEVEINNFQSHKNTVVKFSPSSLNALVGESNNGKTAIMRAINWCLYNEPKGTDFIKDGEKFVSVSITFSNGKKLTRRRTNSETGYYEITDIATGHVEKYAKFGTSLPVEIYNTHQMPKITLAKEPVSLNVSEQLDGPFMLSWSSSERASAIGKITKTDVADNAIANVSKDIVNLQREIKSIEKEIIDLEQKITTYDYLVDEKLLLDKVKILLDLKFDKEKHSETLIKLQKEYNNILIENRMAQLTLSNSPDTQKVDSLVAIIEKKMLNLDRLKVLKEDFSNNKNATDASIAIIKKYNNIQAISEITQQIESINTKLIANTQRLNAYNTIVSQIETIKESINKGINYVNAIKIIDDSAIIQIENHAKSLIELKAKKEEYDYYQKQIEKANVRAQDEKMFIETQESIIASTKEEYKNLLLEVGQCPVCGSNLTEHCNFEL